MYLRVSVTDRCNLRCGYCLPENALFATSSITAHEIDQLMAAICAAIPVHKIRITGGEPTLSPHLLGHIRAATWLVPTVGMTTNGVLLERLLPELRAAGLQRLNISLDAANAAGFLANTRRDRFTEVASSVRAAVSHGFTPLKINAVATVDTDPVALARFAIAERVHLRFIELMDIGVAHGNWQQRYIDSHTLRERLRAGGIDVNESTELDEPTSRVWTVAGVDPAATSLGFITTRSDPFCATCDRIRLTSQGRLHTCLFDEAGTDLITWLRAGDLNGLTATIRKAVAAKAPPARFQRNGAMAAIGG
ncbi:MAG: radical SAM protein [Planctomycetota bacterium]